VNQSSHDNIAALEDSNPRPFGYESYALINCAITTRVTSTWTNTITCDLVFEQLPGIMCFTMKAIWTNKCEMLLIYGNFFTDNRPNVPGNLYAFKESNRKMKCHLNIIRLGLKNWYKRSVPNHVRLQIVFCVSNATNWLQQVLITM